MYYSCIRAKQKISFKLLKNGQTYLKIFRCMAKHYEWKGEKIDHPIKSFF